MKNLVSLLTQLLLIGFFTSSALAFDFEDLERYAFHSNLDHKTEGLLIVYQGQTIYEKYAQNYGPERKHLFWSAAKSITGLLIGMAVDDNMLSLETRVSEVYPQIKSPNITVRHLMRMSSGLEWNEGYEGNPLRSHVVRMLYTDGQKDMALFKTQRDVVAAPGERFNYSSGETNLLMGLLRASLPQGSYQDYPWVKLFNKLGIDSAVWEKDQTGLFVGSSYLYMTPRDMAKIGQLYLQNGRWEEEQLVSKKWIDFTKQMAPAFLKTKLEGFANREGYGGQFWLNQDLPEKGLPRPYPDAPTDTIMALGHHGQALIVIPSKELIVVRTALDKKGPIDRNKLLKYILKEIRSAK